MISVGVYVVEAKVIRLRQLPTEYPEIVLSSQVVADVEVGE